LVIDSNTELAFAVAAQPFQPDQTSASLLFDATSSTTWRVDVRFTRRKQLTN
jgi:hypothetical protein